MKCLYIDTSSSFLYSAISNNGKLLTSTSEELDHDLSKITLVKISNMFKEINMKPQDIDKIIVVNGPGSFTGIRVGITIAKVYAWGLKKDICCVSSLEAMACSAKATSFKYIVPIIDARRNFVYAAIYDTSYNVVLEPQHINLDILKQKMSELGSCLIITNDDINTDVKTVPYVPNMLKIIKKNENNHSINPHSVNPNYLKLTEAEEKIANI